MVKKDFTSPAAQFFGDREEPAAPAELDSEKVIPEPPEGYKLDPRFIEKKTQRVQLVMQPSLYKRAQKAAKKKKISFNELIHQLLNDYLEKESIDK